MTDGKKANGQRDQKLIWGRCLPDTVEREHFKKKRNEEGHNRGGL